MLLGETLITCLLYKPIFIDLQLTSSHSCDTCMVSRSTWVRELHRTMMDLSHSCSVGSHQYYFLVKV